MSPRVARFRLKRFTSLSPPKNVSPTETLSARAAQILTLISHGHSVPDVAQRLYLSTHTVSTHVKNIYGKLAVSNRVQAVNRAREIGQIR